MRAFFVCTIKGPYLWTVERASDPVSAAANVAARWGLRVDDVDAR